jgi:hypothetical protein
MLLTIVRMSRAVIVLLLVGVLVRQGGDRAAAQGSQAAPWPFQLEWESAASGGTTYQLCVDGNCSFIAASPHGGSTWRAPLPLLPPGEHRLVVQACTPDSCTPGTPDLMVRVTTPTGSTRQPPIQIIEGPRIPLPAR